MTTFNFSFISHVRVALFLACFASVLAYFSFYFMLYEPFKMSDTRRLFTRSFTDWCKAPPAKQRSYKSSWDSALYKSLSEVRQ